MFQNCKICLTWIILWYEKYHLHQNSSTWPYRTFPLKIGVLVWWKGLKSNFNPVPFTLYSCHFIFFDVTGHLIADTCPHNFKGGLSKKISLILHAMLPSLRIELTQMKSFSIWWFNSTGRIWVSFKIIGWLFHTKALCLVTVKLWPPICMASHFELHKFVHSRMGLLPDT